ncbi:hypothetical protein OS493_008004 [Desmophyllum pertusum]|uniref:Uncharacterized protein n=1 Tax=Desmophyllum pertusum TaxID=174260 RepID=A0A9X0CGB8_9CNID|nr:hypothetical protein OS493_008004 [Desmophyllum pertusum]
MNKKRFMEFASYVEGFTQRIIIHFPNAKDFVDNEKKEMLEKFPELATSSNPSSRQSQFDVVKYTLDSSVNNERRMCYHDVEIKMNSPEECVETINTLARAVGNAHRDILYYSSIQETALADCEGTQPYLFEPYDSEASSGTDSTDESEEGQFERLQNTDW